MAQLYKYYQLIGGDEPWTPIQADADLDKLKPTFVTALATDTLFADDTPKDLVQKAKYQGPMYLDLDSSDIAESIEGAKTLWAKLQKYELTASDVQIFLSGKKGLHFIIPEVCYVQKAQPTQGLVAIYKEMAFALAVDTLDFRVYTAKRGRQFRTCYNVRENGNYKVPITALELETLTAENYADYCKAPRTVSGHAPAWRGKFALMYDQAAQKIGKIKPKVMKPVSPEMLRQQLPLFTKLASGQVETSGGFNVIAMQLGLYARESGWSEDQLVQLCAGLIESHNSDGSRYNTPRRRERELRRMFWYLEDNPAFDYSAAGIKSCLKAEPILIPVTDETGQAVDDEADIEVGEESQFGGVYAGRSAYMAVKGEDGDVAISNFVLRKVRVLRDLEEGSIIQIIANVHVSGKLVSEGIFIPANFTGNTGLQNAISTYGGSFSGSDVHARGVYQTMLREIAEDSYVVDSEGVNIVTVGRKGAKEFVIWADRDGVKSAATDIGVNLTFQGFPDVRGLYRTDLLSAPTLAELLSSEAGRASALKCFSTLVRVHTPDVIGKMLGWSVAAFFAPLFQKVHGRFPLLHVYGPAGNGKCLAKGTKVLKACGTAVPVEQLQVGDTLLSPTGAAQMVTSLAAGQERMWKVTPVKGDSYVVNESHILSLRRSTKDGVRLTDGTYISKDVDVLNVNVVEFYRNKSLQKAFKGWRSEVEQVFHREDAQLPLDPYWLGMWLGDGDSRRPYITKPETAAIRACVNYANAVGVTVTRDEDPRSAGLFSWRFTGNGFFRDGLAQLGVLQGRDDAESRKHIPDAYKFAKPEVRKQLLAGLLDADGTVNCGGFELTLKNEALAEGAAFLARSLGLAAYVAQVQKGIKSSVFVGTYYRVTISGDCGKIPTLVKIPAPRAQIKRVTVTGITVEPLEVGDYYGFTLDGDHLFMLEDFTVTHNTDTIRGLLRMYYHRAELAETSPNSSMFAMQQFLGGSASIPLFVDEYKPHEMQGDKHNQIRALFRDAYNAKDVQRGGGSRSVKDNFNALSSIKLAAPIVFAAEAPETETAIVERSVMVSFRRLTGRQQIECYKNALQFYDNTTPLASLGLELASRIVGENDPKKTLERFGKLLEWANEKFLPAPDDYEQVAAGTMTQQQMRARAVMRPRPVFNGTVAFFGLQILKTVLTESFGADVFEKEFAEVFKEMGRGCFVGMDTLAAATLPEFVKVLSVFSDMSKLQNSDYALNENVDYNLSELGGKPVLVVAAVQCYRKYRAYMRSLAAQPLYPSEESFHLALREIPQFMQQGMGTKRLETATCVLDLEELYRAAVPTWKGAAVELKF